MEVFLINFSEGTLQWGWEALGCHGNVLGLSKMAAPPSLGIQLLWGVETPDLNLVCPEGKPPQDKKGQESLG